MIVRMFFDINIIHLKVARVVCLCEFALPLVYTYIDPYNTIETTPSIRNASIL